MSTLNLTPEQGGLTAALPQYKMMGPKLYLNGFPKSGLHLLWTWAAQFVAEPAYTPKPWAGSFQGNAWTTIWSDSEIMFKKLSTLRHGTYLKGHCGYRADIEQYMIDNRFIHLFIYRDPRDVAVSQAYHILNANEARGDYGAVLYHDGADDIKRMAKGDFDYILAACIAGYGPWAGVIERWELYAPWLTRNWVLSMKFEDMRTKPRDIARRMIKVIYGSNAAMHGFHLQLYKHDVDKAVDNLLHNADEARDKSPTYRKGQPGGWRTHFTADHIDLWKENDPSDWVTRLGYSWE